MKIKLLMLTILGLFLFACQADSEEFYLENDSQSTLSKKYGSDGAGLVSVPFKADFSVWDHSDYSSCGEEGWFNMTMIGHGNISHLGKMTTTMYFCLDTNTGAYYDVDGTFVAANGDELYFDVPEGQIFPNEGDNFPYYDSLFDDPIIITGGTGRFEDATSVGITTNAFVHNFPDDWRTDFFSEGTLILKRGKR